MLWFDDIVSCFVRETIVRAMLWLKCALFRFYLESIWTRRFFIVVKDKDRIWKLKIDGSLIVLDLHLQFSFCFDTKRIMIFFCCIAILSDRKYIVHVDMHIGNELTCYTFDKKIIFLTMMYVILIWYINLRIIFYMPFRVDYQKRVFFYQWPDNI